MYDLNQIPYDYTVEVRNGFKGLDLIECLMNYGRMNYDIEKETGIKSIPKKKKCKKTQWLTEEALQIAVKRREAKSKREKERYAHLMAEFQRITRREGTSVQFSSVQFSRSVISESLQPHESQHARPICPSPTPRVYLNPCPSSW